MERPKPQLGTQDETFLERIAAWIIDGIIILLFFFVIARFGGRFGTNVLLAFVANSVYKIVFEATYGQTIGKRLLGVVVVQQDGSDCTWAASILRNVLRVIDGLPAFYLLGFVAILVSKDGQRIGDVVANTVVTEVASKPREYTLTVNAEDGDGDALEGADVNVDGESDQTDAEGAVTFELEESDYDVSASLDGYESASESISIDGEDVEVTLTLIEEETERQPSGLLVDEVRRRGDDTYLVLRNVDEKAIDLSDAEIDDVNGNRHPFPGAVTIDPNTTETFRFGESTEFDPDYGTPLVLFMRGNEYEIGWEE